MLLAWLFLKVYDAADLMILLCLHTQFVFLMLQLLIIDSDAANASEEYHCKDQYDNC